LVSAIRGRSYDPFYFGRSDIAPILDRIASGSELRKHVGVERLKCGIHLSRRQVSALLLRCPPKALPVETDEPTEALYAGHERKGSANGFPPVRLNESSRFGSRVASA
jgi:hypothetical protein